MEELTNFAEKNDLELQVFERSDPTLHRYYTYFKNVEVKSVRLLVGYFGNGNTIDEAIKDYCKEISEKLLIVDASSDERRELTCPKLIHTKLMEKHKVGTIGGGNPVLIEQFVKEIKDITSDQTLDWQYFGGRAVIYTTDKEKYDTDVFYFRMHVMNFSPDPAIYTEEDLRQAFYKGREQATLPDEKRTAMFIRPTFEGYLRELNGNEDPYENWRLRCESFITDHI